MSIFSRPRVSLEAIRHFRSTEFKDKLIKATAHLIDNDRGKSDILASGIEKLIFDQFGYKVELEISKETWMNASVYPPDIIQNHAMMTKDFREFYQGTDAVKFLRRMNKNSISGSFNTETGKISGDFTKLTSRIVIGDSLLEHYVDKPAQVAAIIAHEIGHISTYFELLTAMLTTHMAMNAICSGFLNSEGLEMKTEIVVAGAEVLGLSKIDVGDLDKINDKEVLTSLFLNRAMEEPTSLLGSMIHDMRNYESSSDQFVSRIGLGVELGQATDTLYRMGNDISTMSTVQWTLLNTYISLFLGIYLPIVIPLMLVFGGQPDADTYDNLPKRLLRIKNDAIDKLRNAKLSKAEKERILADINSLDALITPLKDREFFFVKVIRLCKGTWRSQKQIMERQKLYESLGNNSLYVHAARFGTATVESAEVMTGEFEDGTEQSMDILDQYENLYSQAESLKAANNTESLENYKERNAALEDNFIGIVAASILALASLMYTVYKFFNSDKLEESAEEWVKEIKNIIDDPDSTKVDHVDVIENSDTMTELLEIPAIATAFDSSVAPATAKMIDNAVKMVEGLSSRTSLDNSGSIDKMLSRIDKLSDEERAKELEDIRKDYEAVLDVLSDTAGLSKELGVEEPTAGSNPIADGKNKLKFFISCVSAASSPSKLITPPRNALDKLNRSKVYNTASACQASISRFRVFTKKGDKISADLKKASQKLKTMETDGSVEHLKEYIELNKRIVSLTMKMGKMLIVRLKGQRDVLNLLTQLNKK